jgi:hypothetical protein
MFSLPIFSVSVCADTGKGYYRPASGIKVNFTRQSAKESMNDLLQVVIQNAKRQIEANGFFSPFGIVITNKGTYQVIVGNGKDTAKDLTMIRNTYRRKARGKSIVAAAIVYNTSVEVPNQTKPLDAIYVNCDNIYTGPRNGYIPYSKSEDGSYQYEKSVKLAEDKTKIFP